MSKGILGKKMGMSQVFRENGKVVAVSILKAGPCNILQIKSKERDKYQAVQLGFDDVKNSKVKKPMRSVFKRAKTSAKKFIKEIPVENMEEYKSKDKILIDIFKPGEYVDITGASKGKGFQGGVKRWGWKIGPKSHGSRSHRIPGSIGASSDPSRVVKGKHLPGRMGNKTVTVRNLEIIKVILERNILVVKGHIPGARNSYLVIKQSSKNQKSKYYQDENTTKSKHIPNLK